MRRASFSNLQISSFPPKTNTDTQMSGFIGSLIENHHQRSWVSIVFNQSPPHLPEAPLIKNTAAVPLPPMACLRGKRTKENGNYSQKLLCVKKRRARNNLAFKQMLIHSCHWITGQRWDWPCGRKSRNKSSFQCFYDYHLSVENCCVLFNV